MNRFNPLPPTGRPTMKSAGGDWVIRQLWLLERASKVTSCLKNYELDEIRLNCKIRSEILQFKIKIENMKMKKLLLFTLSHLISVAIGFAAGIYALPILIAPEAPSSAQIQSLMDKVEYKGTFRKDLKGSDLLHWGKGQVFIGNNKIALTGTLAPGPDYKIYLTPKYVETEKDFLAIKEKSVRLGDVKTFNNFIVPFSKPVDLTQYTTVVVWCETFSQFITAAKYR